MYRTQIQRNKVLKITFPRKENTLNDENNEQLIFF